MKIKSTEIRSGNYHEGADISHPRMGICSIKVGGQSFNAITAHGIHLVEDGKMEFKPLILTEEWLQRLGFIKKDEKKYVRAIHDYVYVLTRDWRKEPSYHFGIEYTDSPDPNDDGVVYNFSFEIKYVHQLQNLYFALTGEELIIK